MRKHTWELKWFPKQAVVRIRLPKVYAVKFGMQGIWGSTIYKGPAERNFLGQEGSQDLHKNFTKGQMWVRLSLTGIRGHLLCPLWTSCLLFDLTWTNHAVSQASVIFSPANGQYLLQAVMNEHCWKWLENCIGTLGAWSVGELHHYIQPPPLLCLRPTLLGNVTYISGFVSSGPHSFISVFRTLSELYLTTFISCPGQGRCCIKRRPHTHIAKLIAR